MSTWKDIWCKIKNRRITNNNGRKEWQVNGKLHREDGPAAEESDGYKVWYINGKKHREDGPAVGWGNNKFWYLNDEETTEEEIRKLILIKEMAGMK